MLSVKNAILQVLKTHKSLSRAQILWIVKGLPIKNPRKRKATIIRQLNRLINDEHKIIRQKNGKYSLRRKARVKKREVAVDGGGTFTVSKKIEISAAHKLDLPYDSPCKRLHGHNWIIEVEISCPTLNKQGMVVDFKCLKEAMERVIKETFDHQNLSDIAIVGFINPTAENIARWVALEMQNYIMGDGPEEADSIPNLPKVSKVTVQESEGNKACYIP